MASGVGDLEYMVARQRTSHLVFVKRENDLKQTKKVFPVRDYPPFEISVPFKPSRKFKLNAMLREESLVVGICTCTVAHSNWVVVPAKQLNVPKRSCLHWWVKCNLRGDFPSSKMMRERRFKSSFPLCYGCRVNQAPTFNFWRKYIVSSICRPPLCQIWRMGSDSWKVMPHHKFY